VLIKAAHGKFTQMQILNMEREIWQSLRFYIHFKTIYEEAMVTLNYIIIYSKGQKLSKAAMK
jgi:hypothetical protein